jgi:hypothetical protein
MANRELEQRESERSENKGEKLVDVIVEKREEEPLQSIEEAFTYMIGTYAVRPFLRKLDDFAARLEERRFQEGRRRLDERLDEITGKRGGAVRGVVDRMRAKVKELRKGLEGKVKGLCKKLTRRKRELCFGEIESGEGSEIGRLDGEGERKIGVARRDTMEDGLLWYYGDEGVLAFQARGEMKQILGEEKTEERTEEVGTATACLVGPKVNN